MEILKPFLDAKDEDKREACVLIEPQLFKSITSNTRYYIKEHYDTTKRIGNAPKNNHIAEIFKLTKHWREYLKGDQGILGQGGNMWLSGDMKTTFIDTPVNSSVLAKRFRRLRATLEHLEETGLESQIAIVRKVKGILGME